jgi:hypothetical protein
MVESSVTLTRRALDVLCLLIVLAVAALAVGPAGIVQQVQARWKPEFANAPQAAWYAQQHDKEGWSCCNRGDAHPVYDAYIERGNGMCRSAALITKSSLIKFSTVPIRPATPWCGTMVTAIMSRSSASLRGRCIER